MVASPGFGIGSVFSLVFGLAFVSILFSALSGVVRSATQKKDQNDDNW